jgi:hypothetical protein
MNLRSAVQTYLAEALSIDLPAMQAWPGAKRFPRYLADAYSFDTLVLWGKPLLCMVVKASVSGTTELQKHVRLVEQVAGLPVLLVLAELTARQRARLIELFLPFVVPGKQLFLPPLGLDLREQYAAAVRRQMPLLGPATQAVLLAGLLGRWGKGANASMMARQLGYSPMSMSRAGRELLDLRFLVVEGASRSARWCLAAPVIEVWRKAEPLLRSPVLRRGWVKQGDLETDDLAQAGLSALAGQTMLATPALPVFALGEAAWQALSERTPGLRLEDEPMVDAARIELWCYEPRSLMPADSVYVDPYSLTLSLRDEAASDDRVALALDELMQGAER